MHPLFTRQLAAATGEDGQVDLKALAASIGAIYESMGRQHAACKAEAKRLVSELEVQNERFATALEIMSHGLCFFDGERRLIACNRRYAEMYGLATEHVRPGTRMSEIIERRFAAGTFPAMSGAGHLAWRKILSAGNRPGAAIVELRDGRVFAVRRHPLPGGGWASSHEDITEQHQAEKRLAHMARHDGLTGLPNLTLLRERLEEMLARTHRPPACALLWLDLDRFRRINDTEGHAAGDRLLRAAAARMRRLLRETDIIARIRGDEFAIVQRSIGQPAGAAALASRLVAELGSPFEIDGRLFVIGASIGIAVVPTAGTDADQLLKSADIALHRAKAEGRGRYRFFEPEMDALMQARRILEHDLRKALAEGEFELFYQPLVQIETRRLGGFEALIRWRHPARGLVSPGEFIPFAEEIGLITRLDDWVLHEACREAAGWPAAVNIAVNLSAAHFRSGAVVATVAAALADSGLPPDRLEIEITESMMIEESESALACLRQLRNLGVRISMDDFGTGYSSLGYLRTFRFDKIKIDQSFIRELGARTDSIAIIHAVIGLCSSLGMAITAEGVETEEQLAVLAREGCTEAQGYLFGPPCPASEIPCLVGRLGPHLARAA